MKRKRSLGLSLLHLLCPFFRITLPSIVNSPYGNSLPDRSRMYSENNLTTTLLSRNPCSSTMYVWILSGSKSFAIPSISLRIFLNISFWLLLLSLMPGIPSRSDKKSIISTKVCIDLRKGWVQIFRGSLQNQRVGQIATIHWKQPRWADARLLKQTAAYSARTNRYGSVLCYDLLQFFVPLLYPLLLSSLLWIYSTPLRLQILLPSTVENFWNWQKTKLSSQLHWSPFYGCEYIQ